MRRSKSRRNVGVRAFTLIEVMIVILIVLALGGLVAYNLLGQQKKAISSLGQADLNTLKGALRLFHLNHERYPTDEEGIKALWDKTAITDEEEAKKWGKLLESPMLKDRWGNEWGYRQQSEHGDPEIYDLWSYGPDKQEGTEDDIVSWDKNAEDGTGTPSGTAGGATAGTTGG